MNDKIQSLGQIKLANFLTENVSEFSGFIFFSVNNQSKSVVKINCKHIIGDFVLQLQKNNLAVWYCSFYTEHSRNLTKQQRQRLRQDTKEWIEPALQALPYKEYYKLTAAVLCRYMAQSVELMAHLKEWPDSPRVPVDYVAITPSSWLISGVAAIRVIRTTHIPTRKKPLRHTTFILIKPYRSEWLTTNCMGGLVPKQPKGQTYTLIAAVVMQAYNCEKGIYDDNLRLGQ